MSLPIETENLGKRCRRVAAVGGLHLHGPRRRTPFERVCTSGVLASQRQQILERLRQETNSRQLRREIYDLIDHIVASPLAKAGHTPSVQATLLPAGRWDRWPCWQPAPLGRNPKPLGACPSSVQPPLPGHGQEPPDEFSALGLSAGQAQQKRAAPCGACPAVHPPPRRSGRVPK